MWPSEDVSKLGGNPGRSPKSLVDMKSAMEEKNKRLICLKEAPLKEEELVGGRLYTGPLFIKYNSVLRGVDSTSDFLQTQFISLCCAKEVGERFEKSNKSFIDFATAKAHANLYTSTLHAINSAIVKMSKLTRAAKVYRGIADKALPAEFWEKNEFGVCGGVEAAFMSTTTTRDVAMGYAGEGSAGVVFEIQMGMVRGPLTHRSPHPAVSRTRPSRRWTEAQNSSGCRSTHTGRRSSSGRSPALRCCRFALTVKPCIDGPPDKSMSGKTTMPPEMESSSPSPSSSEAS